MAFGALWKQEPLRSQVMWEHWDHEASLTDILRVHEVSSHIGPGKDQGVLKRHVAPDSSALGRG